MRGVSKDCHFDSKGESEAFMAARKQTVAEYLTARMNAVGKTNADLARETGYPPQNVSFISMIRNGKAKLPINKVVLFAKALEEDPVFLLRKVLQEYSPDTAAVIEEVIESRMGTLTQGERELLDVFRRESAGLPVQLTEAEMKPVREVFKVAQKRMRNDPTTKRVYDRQQGGWVVPGTAGGNKVATAT
jgi:SOS-response transcriptional repressor LexA